MNKTIIVLTTLINGCKNFVAHQMTTAEGGRVYVVNYCRDASIAKEFATEAEARAFIPKIKNPHERVFAVETATINVQKRATVLNMAREEQLV
jgi:hypothetical protein